MPNFKKYNYQQDAMVVINFERQLQPNTFEFTLHHLIDTHIDLSAFYDKFNNDEGGRRAYDPAILLKIVLFAYSKGITSSREIQWQCEHNIIFKALACDFVPHFTSIASFVSRYPDAIEAVFEQVLLVCDQQGLLGNELFAIDGCKMSSNASKEHSGTFAELEQKSNKLRKRIRQCLEAHQQLDGRKRDERDRKWQVTQEMETLEKQFKRIDQFLKTQRPRRGQGKQQREVKSNLTDNESAKMTTSKGTIQGYNGVATMDKKHQIIIDAQAFGASQEQHTLKPVLETIKERYKKLKLSEDIYQDQVTITADTGFSSQSNDRYLREQQINAYIPDNQFRSRDPRFNTQKAKYGKRHQDSVKGLKPVIPAREFEFNAHRKTCTCPEGKPMWIHRETPQANGNTQIVFEGRLTDCRACPRKEECLRNPLSADHRKGHGRLVSFMLKSKDSATEWMKRRVDSQQGKVIYGHRMSTVEPVFGNIGTNKRLSRFSLRGQKKVEGQWKLYCLVHNIEKIMNYGAIG